MLLMGTADHETGGKIDARSTVRRADGGELVELNDMTILSGGRRPKLGVAAQVMRNVSAEVGDEVPAYFDARTGALVFDLEGVFRDGTE